MSEPTPSDPSSADSTATATAAAPPMSEARRRAEARKAKIQARGGAGLAKLAHTARGEEGAKMYDTTPPVARNASSNSLSSIPPPFTSASGGNAATQDDLFASLVPPGGANGSSPFGPGGPGTGDDPFAAMLAAMSGAGGGVPGANPFGNMFPPPPGGGNGQDGGDPLAGLGGFQQQAAMEQEYSKAKTLSDKLFTLAHLLGVLALAACIVFVWEPVVLARRVNAGGSTAIPAVGVELPVFWSFVTLELILQTSRLLLFRSRPPPSAILTFLSPFLPFLPSKLKTYLFTAARYVSITTQFFQDLCVLLCALGLARWAQGRGNGLLGGGRMTADVAGGGL